MWSSRRNARALPLAVAWLIPACGGSSTAQREPATPPTAAPNPDVGKDNAEREAALRRQAPSTTPAHVDTPEPEPTR